MQEVSTLSIVKYKKGNSDILLIFWISIKRVILCRKAIKFCT